jgi:hypothetical protein
MSNTDDRLDQVAAGTLIRARPWDVTGAALGIPMILWGFLSWFGVVGDAGGGVPGFFSGTGAAGIGLVLAASAVSINQILAGRAYTAGAPSVQILLSAAGAVIVLGGLIAKPDSATIQVGAVVGLFTAIAQTAALTVAWLHGSDKTVKSANVRILNAQQAAADQVAQIAAAQRATSVPPPTWGAPGYPSQYGQTQQPYPPQYGQPQQPYPPQYGQPQQPYPPQYGQPQQPYAPQQQPPYGQPPYSPPPYSQPHRH